MSLGRNFAYTCNNYTDEHQAAIRAIPCRYNVYGYEVGEQDHVPHLQGQICFDKPKRFSAVIKLLPHSHVTLTRDLQDSIVYCKKGGNFWEDGTPPLKKNEKKSDSISFDDVINCEDWEAVLRIPNISCKLTWAKDVWRRKPRPLTELPSVLHDWQIKEIASLLEQDNRKIRFIVDYKGGIGKTVLAKTLVQDHGAYYTRGGKHADIAFAYDYQPIVCFDLSRSNEESHWPYPVMECFKDGMLFSGKYESTTKTMPSCKVIVLCNQYPDRTKLSDDRFDIWEANQPMN